MEKEKDLTLSKDNKILLRRFRTEDSEPLWDTINNQQFNKLTGTHGTFTREMIDNYVAKQIANDDDERAAFIIALTDDSRAVGEVVINELDHHNHSGNIRISLFYPADLGQGYGTEAMRQMINYGFKNLVLHRLSLVVYAFNPRAIHMYEKLGFKREGVLRDALFWEGEYVDGIAMSLLTHEWDGIDDSQ